MRAGVHKMPSAMPVFIAGGKWKSSAVPRTSSVMKNAKGWVQYVPTLIADTAGGKQKMGCANDKSLTNHPIHSIAKSRTF